MDRVAPLDVHIGHLSISSPACFYLSMLTNQQTDLSKESLFPECPAKLLRKGRRRPRILLVTPELGESRLLARKGCQSPLMKAGGLADVSALLLDSLADAGVDVHVAVPHYRGLSQIFPATQCRQLHLCEDREFFHRRSVYDGSPGSNLRAALAFQRDVIYYTLPEVRPDIVHCHDWMTGLIPAAARAMGIPSLFTIHNLHDERTVLSYLEEKGLETSRFWQQLYYQDYPDSFHSWRDSNPLSLLASGILAADQVNTVSPSFLHELSVGGHGTASWVVDAIRGKLHAGRAHGILNGLSSRVAPDHDPYLSHHYDAVGHVKGKKTNKRAFQRLLGLEQDDEVPLLFWPSRLDPTQKGCDLLAQILYGLVSDYWGLGLQVAFVADGPFQQHFRRIADFHGLHHRIAVADFKEDLSHLGYAASDFTLMPSSYEPCGLAQMKALRFGSLPIVHATGGLRDTVSVLDATASTGNGFRFEVHNAEGLRWAIDQAMRFYLLPASQREANVTRVMTEAAKSFLPSKMVEEYTGLYRDLLALR